MPGLVCKDGAEGVWAAALPDGRAFAAKIADGAARALPPVLAAVLEHWGMRATEVVRRWSAVPVLGGGAPVGAIAWSRRTARGPASALPRAEPQSGRAPRRPGRTAGRAGRRATAPSAVPVER